MKLPLRLSMRTLLAFVAVFSIYCYWATRAERSANRLVCAIAGDRCSAADALFQNPDDRVFAHWATWRTLDEFDGKLTIDVKKTSRSLADLMLGRRRVVISAKFFGPGLCGHASISGHACITPSGIQTPTLADGTLLVSGPACAYLAFVERFSISPLNLICEIPVWYMLGPEKSSPTYKLRLSYGRYNVAMPTR